MNQKFANLSHALLAQSIDTTDTQFSVKNAVEVPSISAGEFFIATVFTTGSNYGTNIEIVKVVQVAGNLWTVERGQEDTTAKEHPQDSRIELRLTAGALSDIYKDIGNKVDKVVGQGLSDSNYTLAEKTKLAGTALEATKNRDDGENADKLHTHKLSEVTGLDTALADKASKTELTDRLALKADRVEGKVFSDTNFTQAEKDKLAGLESSKFVGLFVSDSELPTTGSIGDYANVDGGVGNDVYRVIWDSTNSKWVRLQGVSTALTDAQIKQQYESNPDTNAFTDDNKTKLTGIAIGATKNRVDSENADKVHTHATAQVTGLDTVLLNKVDKVAGKGLSSTDFTQVEKTKLAGVATGATANRADALNADKTHAHTTAQVTGLDTALGSKANKTTRVIAGNGLTGGGTLEADRTLAVSYGTAAGTAAQGNDSRLSNNREWTASTVSQTEAQAGTATTDRKWTAQRVAQAISALGLKIGTTASTAKAGNWMPTWANVTGKPTTFAPSTHTHSLSQITDAGSVASLNTNASTANFLRGDGTWVTPPNTNTTYTEITTAEIDAGTASTLRTISGRRMKYALDKKANTGTQVIAGTGLSGGGTLAANRTLAVSYGTAAGTAAQGNDSRIVNAVPNSRTITAGTGLTGGGTLAANRTLSVSYGTTAGTAAQGNDARITGALQKSQVVQTNGASTTNVMSQKATTEAIANIPPVSKSSAYTVVAGDKGKSIDTTSNVTIRASVFTVGDVIVVTNTSATNSSILAASGVTIRLAGSTKTGTRTLAGYGVATLRMVSNNVWFASGAGLT